MPAVVMFGGVRRLLLWGLLLSGLLAGLSAGPAAAIEANVVVLQGLDKVTARTATFEVPVGSAHRFGTLEITVHHCWKAPPEEPPENKAFLEIVDIRPDREPKTVFTGWMFSSSPALNALEHPVYDVQVETCKVVEDPAAGDETPPKPDELPERPE
jgi:hypothetical protein